MYSSTKLFFVFVFSRFKFVLVLCSVVTSCFFFSRVYNLIRLMLCVCVCVRVFLFLFWLGKVTFTHFLLINSLFHLNNLVSMCCVHVPLVHQQYITKLNSVVYSSLYVCRLFSSYRRNIIPCPYQVWLHDRRKTFHSKDQTVSAGDSDTYCVCSYRISVAQNGHVLVALSLPFSVILYSESNEKLHLRIRTVSVNGYRYIPANGKTEKKNVDK